MRPALLYLSRYVLDVPSHEKPNTIDELKAIFFHGSSICGDVKNALMLREVEHRLSSLPSITPQDFPYDGATVLSSFNSLERVERIKEHITSHCDLSSSSFSSSSEASSSGVDLARVVADSIAASGPLFKTFEHLGYSAQNHEVIIRAVVRGEIPFLINFIWKAPLNNIAVSCPDTRRISNA
jgi:hypothetical protein